MYKVYCEEQLELLYAQQKAKYPVGDTNIKTITESKETEILAEELVSLIKARFLEGKDEFVNYEEMDQDVNLDVDVDWDDNYFEELPAKKRALYDRPKIEYDENEYDY